MAYTGNAAGIDSKVDEATAIEVVVLRRITCAEYKILQLVLSEAPAGEKRDTCRQLVRDLRAKGIQEKMVLQPIVYSAAMKALKGGFTT